MSNEITTKITKLYWKGIIDNCTNCKWWKNKWIVFDYGHFTWEYPFESTYISEKEMKKFSRKLLDKELENAYNDGVDSGLDQSISIVDFVGKRVRENNE